MIIRMYNHIRNHMKNDSSFKFSGVSSSLIYEKLNSININKSTGHDMIPPKLIKLGAKELCVPITYLINKCIKTSTFPKYLKLGEITPVFKKENMLDKRNYRPISTLPCLSKIFEGVFNLWNNFRPILRTYSHLICRVFVKITIVKMCFCVMLKTVRQVLTVIISMDLS